MSEKRESMGSFKLIPPMEEMPHKEIIIIDPKSEIQQLQADKNN